MKRKKYYIFITLLITAIIAATCTQCSVAPTMTTTTEKVGVSQSIETTAAGTTASGTTVATAAATTAAATTATGAQANKVFHINSSVIGSDGTISPLGNQSVNEGSDIKFTMTPNAGYHVGSVVIDGNRTKEYQLDPNTSIATYTFAKVSDDHTIIVQFIQNKT